MIEKVAFAFFILAYYIVSIRVIGYIFPGFLALSALGPLQIAVLVVLIPLCIFFAKKTLDYITK